MRRSLRTEIAFKVLMLDLLSHSKCITMKIKLKYLAKERCTYSENRQGFKVLKHHDSLRDLGAEDCSVCTKISFLHALFNYEV